MRNVLIIGSGRSGTSALTGTLAQAGYFMGEHLYDGRHSNPKGFFEDKEINRINEEIIAAVLPPRPRLLGHWFFRDRPVKMQRWLARVPVGTEFPTPAGIAERIQKLVGRRPYCFKDPRFCYTLPVWRRFTADACHVVVFREPLATARSIVKEVGEMKYLRSLSLNLEQAIEVWTLMYRHVLEQHRHTGDWLFLHYHQLLDGTGLDRLENFTGAKTDRSFMDKNLQRSSADGEIPPATENVYRQLCELASYSPT